MISFPGLLRWFSSPSVALAAYFIQPSKYTKFIRVGYPIRKSRYHRIFASPPGLSQLITSFIALQLLGIRHKPIIRLTILSLPQAILSRTIWSDRLHSLRFIIIPSLNCQTTKAGKSGKKEKERKRLANALCVHIHFPKNGIPFVLQKEVIQPQLPLRLPCYDFTLLTKHTLGSDLPCGLVYRLRVSSTRIV